MTLLSSVANVDIITPFTRADSNKAPFFPINFINVQITSVSRREIDFLPLKCVLLSIFESIEKFVVFEVITWLKLRSYISEMSYGNQVLQNKFISL